MKSILSSKSNRRSQLILIHGVLIFISFLFLNSSPGNAWTQETFAGQGLQTMTQNRSLNSSNEIAQAGDIRTFWSLTKLGGGVSLAIFLVLAMGIFLIVLQVYELIMDKIKSRILLATNYRQLSVNDVNKLVRTYPHSLIARLYSVLLSIFHTTGNTQDFHDEIANYIQLQQDRFNTFKSRLSFLSDTAGALGLLGTVWGMFVTFFGGNLESQRILNGMGLALVTTLIGLVVSIILNFCATEVFSVFNKRLELISAKADEFRLWLMAIVQQRYKKMNEAPPSGSGQVHRQTEPATGQSASKRPPVPSISLQAVSDFKLDGTIGQPLSDPIMVLVETENGQKVSGVPIRYEIAEGGGILDNQYKVAVVKTDKHGLAKLSWTMGREVGPQKLKVSIPNQEQSQLEFVSFAQPFIPNLNSFPDELPGNGSNKELMS